MQCSMSVTASIPSGADKEDAEALDRATDQAVATGAVVMDQDVATGATVKVRVAVTGPVAVVAASVEAAALAAVSVAEDLAAAFSS